MAKQAFPGVASGGVLRKVVGLAVAVALLVLVVKYPADAASWAKAGIGGVGDVIDGLVSFFRSIGA